MGIRAGNMMQRCFTTKVSLGPNVSTSYGIMQLYQTNVAMLTLETL